MKTLHFLLLTLLLIGMAGCRARMTVTTGTTVGLVANPGDGNTRPPRVTLAYRRAETAFVPTDEKNARKEDGKNSDCYSALAFIDFRTKWFGETSIAQFIGTGHAARNLVSTDDKFASAFTKAVAEQIGRENDQVEVMLNWLYDGQGNIVPGNLTRFVQNTRFAAQPEVVGRLNRDQLRQKLKTEWGPDIPAFWRNVPAQP